MLRTPLWSSLVLPLTPPSSVLLGAASSNRCCGGGATQVDGRTALFAAAENGRAGAVKALLRANAAANLGLVGACEWRDRVRHGPVVLAG